MKFTSIVLASLVAIASVEGAAFVNPEAEALDSRGFCDAFGESCSKLKRAAEAAAEAIAGPQSCHGYCYGRGEICSKAKRDALALAEATAEAFAAAYPEARPCHAPGSSCSIAKREAIADCTRDASPDRDRKLTNLSHALLCMYTC